jgi:hypothetical protein
MRPFDPDRVAQPDRVGRQVADGELDERPTPRLSTTVTR